MTLCDVDRLFTHVLQVDNCRLDIGLHLRRLGLSRLSCLHLEDRIRLLPSGCVLHEFLVILEEVLEHQEEREYLVFA